MANQSGQASARLRSATEFPKTVEHLSRTQADELYVEMRDCLVFTNRSRAQLLRRNEEHKQSALRLKTDVERLQGLIYQLTQEKQKLAQSNQLVVAELEKEMSAMAAHLDQLSLAFDGVEDIETAQQTQWSFLSMPRRFFEFIRAVGAVVTWWRQEQPAEDSPVENLSIPQLPAHANQPEERKERPQMYDDPASNNRSLLDR